MAAREHRAHRVETGGAVAPHGREEREPHAAELLEQRASGLREVGRFGLERRPRDHARGTAHSVLTGSASSQRKTPRGDFPQGAPR
jgi:hypothetical protein